MKPESAVAGFDSATGMLRALSRFLRGHDYPLLGQMPRSLERPISTAMGGVNRLPERLQHSLYRWSGWLEAVGADRLGQVRSDELATWVADHYPRRRYPAVLVGSSNGAAMHLAAALGVPWLPQTLLIPVRQRGISPDDPTGDMAAGEAPARALLKANPDLVLHHMHDANQDRLMIARMTYFRVKWRRLAAAYEQFISETLEPGGTVLVVECGLRWPTTRVANGHVFQHGALGGATADEYRHGSPRMADYLARYGSPVRRWDAPQPDGHSPEAEWGFEPSLREDLAALAKDRGYRLRRVAFHHPEQLSPLVADLYRWWYRRRELPADRLLVESFLLLEPWWTLRTGSVPYWTVFSTEPSLRAVEAYLDGADPFDEIRLMLFSHGVNSVGLASIEQWRGLLDRARKIGVFAGVDPQVFPRDFASFVRYRRALAAVRTRYPMPRPLALADLDVFLDEHGDRYRVEWSEG